MKAIFNKFAAMLILAVCMSIVLSCSSNSKEPEFNCKVSCYNHITFNSVGNKDEESPSGFIQIDENKYALKNLLKDSYFDDWTYYEDSEGTIQLDMDDFYVCLGVNMNPIIEKQWSSSIAENLSTYPNIYVEETSQGDITLLLTRKQGSGTLIADAKYYELSTNDRTYGYLEFPYDNKNYFIELGDNDDEDEFFKDPGDTDYEDIPFNENCALEDVVEFTAEKFDTAKDLYANTGSGSSISNIGKLIYKLTNDDTDKVYLGTFEGL